MGKRRFGGALVAALVVASMLAVVPKNPAGAFTFLGCSWGAAPAVATYRLLDLAAGGPGANHRYHGYAQDAINTWNYTLDGRLALVEAQSDTPVSEVGFTIFSDDEGHTGKIGRFHPVCDSNNTLRSGSYLFINRWEADMTLGLKTQEGYSGDPTVLRWGFLHELGHAVGLDHSQWLNRPGSPGNGQVPSNCNIMYATAQSFWTTTENPPRPCAGQGGFLKQDDIEGGWARYPYPGPGGDPTIDPRKYIQDNLCCP